jgi:DNA-binding NtrC family response regulator
MSNGRTILIVDDDQSIVSIFEFIVGQAGHSAITASSGQECIDKVRTSEKIDLVFLDLKMEGLNGLKAFEEIKKIDPFVPVVFMTGHVSDEILKESYESGAYGVVFKPFDVEEVLSIINTIFDSDV